MTGIALTCSISPRSGLRVPDVPTPWRAVWRSVALLRPRPARWSAAHARHRRHPMPPGRDPRAAWSPLRQRPGQPIARSPEQGPPLVQRGVHCGDRRPAHARPGSEVDARRIGPMEAEDCSGRVLDGVSSGGWRQSMSDGQPCAPLLVREPSLPRRHTANRAIASRGSAPRIGLVSAVVTIASDQGGSNVLRDGVARH